MQKAAKYDTISRLVCYGSREISKQIQKGDEYSKLKAVVVIMIIDELKSITGSVKYQIFTDGASPITKYVLKEEERQFNLTNVLSFYIVSLEQYKKLKEKNHDTYAKMEDNLKEWLDLFTSREAGYTVDVIKEINDELIKESEESKTINLFKNMEEENAKIKVKMKEMKEDKAIFFSFMCKQSLLSSKQELLSENRNNDQICREIENDFQKTFRKISQSRANRKDNDIS